MNKISIPFILRKPDHNLYPISNWPDFEYWLSENLKDEEVVGDRIYLGVLFTSFYKNICNYGQDKNGIKILQTFLDSLDRSKKYWGCVQYDDGILNDISHLDIKVFSMAGGRKDYGLPLICQPHRIKFETKKDIFCSFVGRITNPIRQEIVNAYTGKEDYYVSTKAHALPDYCRVLSRSVFGLCPAGYGLNSFRIQECLEYNAIPVYIGSDKLIIHDLDFESFGYWVKPENILKIDLLLKSRTKEEIEDKQKMLSEIFEKYFLFSSNKKLILENL